MHINGSYCNQGSAKQYSKGEYSLWNKLYEYLMYEYSFIIVIMVFKYHSNNINTKYTFGVLEILSQGAFFKWVKGDQGRIHCGLESSEVFHIIDSINVQLGPNCQPSTTKMAVARLRRDAES